MWKNRNLRSLIEGKRQKPLIRDFTTTPLPIPKIFLVVYLLKLSSECLVSYDPHFPGNDGTKKWWIQLRNFLRPKKSKINLRLFTHTWRELDISGEGDFRNHEKRNLYFTIRFQIYTIHFRNDMLPRVLWCGVSFVRTFPLREASFIFKDA